MVKNMDEKEFIGLMKDIRGCRYCAELFGFEPRPVVRGHRQALIMQISQAPSKAVAINGLPFKDASGVKLKRDWYQISEQRFYDEDSFYMCSSAHCYPGRDSRGHDRKPPAVCFQRWVVREAQAVQCRCYVLVGAAAAACFYPRADFIGLVFHDQTLNGRPCFVIPHPSPLNRKWLKDHPDFEAARMPYIRGRLHEILDGR